MREESNPLADAVAGLFTLGIFGLIFFVGFEVGGGMTSIKCENDAVDHKKAEYYINSDHQRAWRWLP